MSAAEPVAFGRYLLEAKLASGGMGEIFLARAHGAAGFEKRVVIKRILPHLAESEEFVERFLDEGRLVVQLNHGNIAQVLDMGEVDGSYYLAMEYVDGLDLRALLQRLRRDEIMTPVTVAMQILVEITKGLDHAHNRVDEHGDRLNVIHRDVSPANVMVSRTGEVKLLDFGIAKVAARVNQSISGSLHGKFLYMSPEQAAARNLDHRSDLFSLGSLAYELLTGIRPFAGDSELKTLDLIRSGQHRVLRDVRPDVPPAVEAIVERCLQIDPDKRFQSAVDLQHAILAWFVESKSVVSATDLAAFVKPYLPIRSQTQPVSLDDALQRQLDDLLSGASGAETARPPTQLARRDILPYESDSFDPITGLNLAPNTSSTTTTRAQVLDASDRSVNVASRNRIFLWSIGLLVFVLVALNIIMINTFGGQKESKESVQANLTVSSPVVSSIPVTETVPPQLGLSAKPNTVAEADAGTTATDATNLVDVSQAQVAGMDMYDHVSTAVRRPRLGVASTVQARKSMVLVLRGLPAKAKVIVDGQAIDSSELTSEGWPVPGTAPVQIRIQANGYESWTRTIARTNTRVVVDVALKARTSTVKVAVVPSNATITHNGKVLGRGIAEVLVAGNAPRRLRIEAPGYQRQTTTVRYGMRSRTVELKSLGMGRVTVMIFPAAAKVTLDGKPLSRSAIRVNRRVTPGIHTIRAEYQSDSAVRRFEIKADETKQLQAIKLSP